MWTDPIERQRLECIFTLGGGELHTPHADFPDPWDNLAPGWYEGAPDYYSNPDAPSWECRTLLGWVQGPSEIDGWRLLETFMTSGEAECWFCGHGTDWDGSDEQDKAPADTCTGYRGNPECKLCEGSGYVYLGDGWYEAIYVSTDEEV